MTQFLESNSGALIGLIGVALGAILAGIVSFLTQSMQRKWALELRRVEWRRERRERQLDHLLSWVNEWLRAASRVRRIESAVYASAPSNKRKQQLAFMQMDKENRDQTTRLGDLTATSAPVVSLIGDDELTYLYEQFRELIEGYKEVFAEDDVAAAIKSNKALVADAKELAGRIQARADQLIEEAYKIK